MADNRKQHNKKALVEALEQSLGVVTTACKHVGINRTTFYKYYKQDKAFRDAVDDIGEVAIDFVESQLFKQIKSGNTASIIFYLKTKAKNRGYVERQEITGELNTNVIKVQFTSTNVLPIHNESDFIDD